MFDMTFREVLWSDLYKAISRAEGVVVVDQFRNKDPDPRNQDVALFIQGDTCNVEVAFFPDYIHVGDDVTNEAVRIEYTDPAIYDCIYEALADRGIVVDPTDMMDVFTTYSDHLQEYTPHEPSD